MDTCHPILSHTLLGYEWDNIRWGVWKLVLDRLMPWALQERHLLGGYPQVHPHPLVSGDLERTLQARPVLRSYPQAILRYENRRHGDSPGCSWASDVEIHMAMHPRSNRSNGIYWDVLMLGGLLISTISGFGGGRQTRRAWLEDRWRVECWWRRFIEFVWTPEL